MRLYRCWFLAFLLLVWWGVHGVAACQAQQATASVAIQAPPQSQADFILPTPATEIPLDQQQNRRRLIPQSSPNDASVTSPPQPLLIQGHARPLQVTHIETNGITLIDADTLTAITDAYLNRTLTETDLKELLKAINKAYRRQGFMTSFAYLPQQPADVNTLTVAAVEGTLGEITLEGYQAFRPQRIAWHIPQRPGDFLNVTELEKTLNTINRTNPYRLKARLSKGKDFGQTHLHLDVLEPSRWQVTPTVDNQGRTFTGLYRWGVEVQNRSLTNRGDALFAKWLGSYGAQSVLANYQYPLNRHGTAVTAGFGYGRANIDLDAGNQPKLLGTALNYSLGVQQPLNKRRTLTVDAGVNFTRSTFDLNSFRLREDHILALQQGLTWQQPDKWGQTTVRAVNTVGVDAFGGDDAFWKGQLFANRWLRLPWDTILMVRGQGQVSSGPLRPSQQFQLGGLYSVRGYTEGLLIGDRGYNASVEYRWPIPFLGKIRPSLKGKIQGAIFADVGQVWASRGQLGPRFTDSNRTLLASAGVGVRFRATQWVEGFCDLGYGVLHRASVEPTAQPTIRVHFGFRSNLIPDSLKKRTGKTYHIR